PPGASLGAFSRDQAISPDGSAVFTAVQGGAGQSIPVLIRSTPAGPQVLARYGDPATGAPAGVTISLMSEAAGLPAGAVFHASLSSPSAPFGQAIYASGTPLA